MDKEKRILSYTISYLLIGLFICLIGISNVFAATTQYWGSTVTQPKQAYFYDCNSSGCTTDYTSSNGIGYDSSGNEYGIYWAYDLNTVANSYGGIAVIRPDTQLLSNKIYSTTVYMCSESSYITPINLFSGSLSQIQSRSYPVDQLTGWGNADLGSSYPYARIELGNAISNPIINNCRAVSFIYTPEVNSSYIGFQFTTGSTVTGNQYLIGYDHEYLGDSESLSEEQVDTIINNQTTEINTNISNMQESISSDIQNTEDNINSNIDDMEQAIVDSNKETQDVIKDQFNTCRDSINLVNIEQVSLNMTNRIYEYQIPNTLPSGTYTLSYNFLTNNSVSKRFQLWLSSDNNTIKYFNLSDSGYITFTMNSSFDKLMFFISSSADSNSNFSINKIQLQKGSVATEYEPYGEKICSNKIDETNDKLDNLTGAITDSSSPNTGALENSAGWLPAGPLDSVLNLPLSLFNALTTNLNKSCNPINIPLPFVNKNITLPCINTLYNQIGITSFLSWIGVIVSGLMLYSYLLKLYKWIEDRISLNETHNVDSWGGL